MTRLALLLLLMVVAARFFWRLVDAVVRGAMGPTPGGRRGGPYDPAQGRAPAAVKMQPCAVCGTYVVPGKALSAVSGGAPVYFCSEKCRADFTPR